MAADWYEILDPQLRILEQAHASAEQHVGNQKFFTAYVVGIWGMIIGGSILS